MVAHDDMTLRIDPRQFEAVAELYRAMPQRAGQLLASAVNETANRGRAQMKRGLRTVANIPKTSTASRVAIAPRATATTPYATVSIKGRRLQLIHFEAYDHGAAKRRGARLRTRRWLTGVAGKIGRGKISGGVSYRIAKGGKRGYVRDAFIAPARYGNLLVFRRVPGAKRYPIIPLRGPSLPVLLASTNWLERIALPDMSDYLSERVRSKIEWALKGGVRA